MNRKYDLVIFDVDGTLLDTTEGVLSAVKYTINTLGYEMLSEKVLSTFIGPPIQDSFAKAYGLEGDILQEIATIFRDQYSKVDLLKAVPYEGIYDVMSSLVDNNIKIAVATYKREDYAITLLKHYGFDKYTNIMFGGDHENKLKKKDIIEKCILESGISDRERIIMVGDTRHDALGAAGSDIDFLGVTYGFGFKEDEEFSGISSKGYVECAKDMLPYFIR